MINRKLSRWLLSGVLGAAACFAAEADAQVLLRLELEGGGQSVVVNPGGSFSFTLSIEARGLEEIEGFSYYLNSEDGLGVEVSNVFAIMDRTSNIALFPAGDLFWTDTEVATAPASLLAPENGLDLGAYLETPLAGPNTFLLGTYTLRAEPMAVAGTYFIAPVMAVWISDGTEFSFNAVDSLSVTVVPEPASAGLLLAGLALACVGKRRI